MHICVPWPGEHRLDNELAYIKPGIKRRGLKRPCAKKIYEKKTCKEMVTKEMEMDFMVNDG